VELLDVHRIPDDRVNRNNEVFARGRRALGYDGGRLRHNRDGCEQSGFCELGCPNNGKQNAAKVLVPAGLESGGRVLTEARVERVLTERAGWLGGRRVTGVEAAAVDPDSGREVASLRIMARRVVLAASATGSAALAQRSGLPDPHGLTGTNLHLHPGGYVVGIFEGARHEPIEGWIGVPQSEDCTEFLEHGSDATRRAWILPGFAHPEAAAALLPGFGAEHGEMMRLYPRIAVAISMVHDYGTGRVAPGEGEQVHIRYSLSDDDAEQMAMGLREAGRILLAAGADRVFIPMNPPFFASTDRQLRALGPEMLGPANPTLVAVHPMSTMWMGSDPTRSVVDPEGAHHHVDGLYVADGSLFPSSIGSAPQIPIYTFGRRVARAVARGL
jgi:choline dehydrogenase-like flavoprotein